MNMELVTSSQGLKALWKLHNLIESHVRSLSALSVGPATYRNLLSSVILNKLPTYLQLMYKQLIRFRTSWNLIHSLKIVEEEIEARRVQPKWGASQQKKTPEQQLPTVTPQCLAAFANIDHSSSTYA